MKKNKKNTKDQNLVEIITVRAIQFTRMLGYKTEQYSKITIQTTLEAVHMNGNPLDLQSFYNANDVDFCHDIFGIINNINKNTLKIKNNFKLKFSLN